MPLGGGAEPASRLGWCRLGNNPRERVLTWGVSRKLKTGLTQTLTVAHISPQDARGGCWRGNGGNGGSERAPRRGHRGPERRGGTGQAGAAVSQGDGRSRLPVTVGGLRGPPRSLCLPEPHLLPSLAEGAELGRSPNPELPRLLPLPRPAGSARPAPGPAWSRRGGCGPCRGAGAVVTDTLLTTSSGRWAGASSGRALSTFRNF